MFIYEKKLQFPVKIAHPNPKLAAFIISQYGGPDGELGASMRYLSQRYAMPYAEAKGVLTDIGTEEAFRTAVRSSCSIGYGRRKTHRAGSRRRATSTLPSAKTVMWSNSCPWNPSPPLSSSTISRIAAGMSCPVERDDKSVL